MLHDIGIEIQKDEVWKGALLAFLADNLAADELGGFKESFSFAWQQTMSLKPISEKVSLHLEIHYHTQIMDGPDSVKSSIEYGVNRRSLRD